MASQYTVIEAAGREVKVSNPGKVFFPELGVTKLDVIDYYLALAQPVLRHLRGRPTSLKRYVDGAGAEPFFQRRVPDSAPEWLQTTTVSSGGRPARMLVVEDEAHLVWGVQQGVIDWNPWASKLPDLGKPDELRIDLDPNAGASWDDVRQVAMVVKRVLEQHGLTGFPKTSGSRGIHVNVRIVAEHDAVTVRRAAVALAREVERQIPELATSKWWKEERGDRVFIDYNQNAPDRTVASAYSLRPTPDARVSTPVTWEELPDAELGDFTITTVPERVAAHGDPTAEMDQQAGSLAKLLQRADEDEQSGLPDAPWPPNFPKMPGEPKRVQPSKARND